MKSKQIVRLYFSCAVLIFLTSCITTGGSISTTGGSISGDIYTSQNKLFLVKMPKSTNWAGVPFRTEELNKKNLPNYDVVGFNLMDFGQYLVAGVRVMPDEAIALMDKDDNNTVLSNLVTPVLHNWRDRYSMGSAISIEHIEDSFVDTEYGKTIISVFVAKNGSFLAKASGRRPTDADRFDTLIAVVLTKKGNKIIYSIAEDDSNPNNKAHLTKWAKGFFDDIKVLN